MLLFLLGRRRSPPQASLPRLPSSVSTLKHASIQVRELKSDSTLQSFHPLAGRCDRKAALLRAKRNDNVSIPLRGDVIGKSDSVQRCKTPLVSIPLRGDVIGKGGKIGNIQAFLKGFHPLAGRCDRKVTNDGGIPRGHQIVSIPLRGDVIGKLGNKNSSLIL